MLGRRVMGVTYPSVRVPTGGPARSRTGLGALSHDGAWNPATIALVILITVIGVVLRIPSFRDSLFGDEISTYWIAVGHSLHQTLQLSRVPQESSPPLFFILAWITRGMLGSAVESIRIPSLVAGTATIPLTYLLGARLVGKRAGLVGAAIVSLAPFMIYYSTEARPNMTLAFVVLLSTISLVYALDSGRVGWWVAYAVFTCAAAYTHYTVFYVLLAQFLWALWAKPNRRRALLISTGAAALAFLPWVSQLAAGFHQPNAIGYYQPFGLHAIELYIPRWALGHPYLLLVHVPGYLAVTVFLTGLALGLLGLVVRRRQDGRAWTRPSPGAVLVIVLAFAAPVGAVLYSSVGPSVFDPRDIISSWPGFALLIGAVVANGPKPLRLLSIGLVLVGFAIGSVTMLLPQNQRPDVDSAAAFINRVGTSGDPIVDGPLYAYPLSELDVAFAEDQSTSKSFPVLRLGAPQRDQMTRASWLRAKGIYPALHPTDPRVVAMLAERMARHGTIFFVAGTSPLVDYGFFPKSPEAQFLGALPKFRVIREGKFGKGFAGAFPVGVFELRYAHTAHS